MQVLLLEEFSPNALVAGEDNVLFCEQQMADLPANRITPDKPPFTSVGVDCFGPLQVRRSRSLVKRYGVIFTCMTIRAVHLEDS